MTRTKLPFNAPVEYSLTLNRNEVELLAILVGVLTEDVGRYQDAAADLFEQLEQFNPHDTYVDQNVFGGVSLYRSHR